MDDNTKVNEATEVKDEPRDETGAKILALLERVAVALETVATHIGFVGSR